MNDHFVIYDTVYKEIKIQELLFQKLIFVPEFQRLKNVHQLGLLMFVRSSIRHTRYSHSLGVFWLLELAFRNPSFDVVSTKEKTEVKVAGLFHDIGHGPLSHTFEKLIPKFKHELYSVQLIRNPQGAIFPLLKKHGLNVERICNLILGKARNDWAQTLISGQFDFDRLDYMIRDQHFTGGEILLIDRSSLLSNISLYKKQIVFNIASLKYVETYLLFRFYLYQQLFLNTKNILLENALRKIFERICELKTKKGALVLNYDEYDFIVQSRLPTISEFLQFDDSDILSLIKKIFTHEQDSILKILSAIFFRPHKHYDQYVSQDPAVISRLSPDKRKYFSYSSLQEILIYEIDKDEIMFLNRDGSIVPLSKISLFFDQTKIYNRVLSLFVDFS